MTGRAVPPGAGCVQVVCENQYERCAGHASGKIEVVHGTDGLVGQKGVHEEQEV